MTHASMVRHLESTTGAATAARQKMEERLQAQLSKAQAVVRTVEETKIDDALVMGGAFGWGVSDLEEGDLLNEILEAAQAGEAPGRSGELKAYYPDGEAFSVHDNALGQFCDKWSLPIRYARYLNGQGQWGVELLAHNFATLSHQDPVRSKRFLVRSVGRQIRGVLSDYYRRIDSRPILDMLIGEFNRAGAVPIDGTVSDTVVSLKAVLPVVFEPVPGECYVYGLDWRNSDFGRGRNAVRIYVERLACLNGMTMNALLAQIHFGKQLDEQIFYSDETLRLETAATVSRMKDIVRHGFSEDLITRTFDVIRTASDKKITPKQAYAYLKDLTKDEQAGTVEAFNSPDIERMPAGQTVYRLANAVSWFAQAETIRPERRLELQEFAGSLLGTVEMKTEEV